MQMKPKEYENDLQKSEAKWEFDKQQAQLNRHHDACERFLGNHIIGAGEPDITAATRESKWRGRVVFDWNVGNINSILQKFIDNYLSFWSIIGNIFSLLLTQ